MVAIVFVCSALGRHAPIEATLQHAEAIAYVRVTSVTEDLKDGLVTRRATLSVVGKAYGIKDVLSFEVPFGLPSKLGSISVASDAPLFILGQRSVVVLKSDGNGQHVLRQIFVSDEGKIEEPEVFRALGFDRGAKADFAVDCLIAAMKKKPTQSPEPTPTAGMPPAGQEGRQP
jgi:hypothetical protein